MQALNCNTILIRKCSFQSARMSVVDSVELANRLASVTIQDSTWSAMYLGIGVFDSEGNGNGTVLLQRVNISNAKYIGLRFMSGIMNNLIIQDSILSGGNEEEGARITGLRNTLRVLIQRTSISHWSGKGLALRSVDNVTITESLIENNDIGVEYSSNTILSTTDFTTHSTIENTVITRNRLGVSVINGAESPVEDFGCINCTFSSNKDAGIEVRHTTPNIVLTDCVFVENLASPIALYGSTVELRGETVFRDNTAERGGGLVLFDSTVIFDEESNTIFINNVAERGGGLALFNSVMVVGTSNIMFINNTAEEFGGGIYIHALPTVLNDEIFSLNSRGIEKTIIILNLDGQECFYDNKDNDSLIIFTDNKARLGGLDIYGATVYTDDCSVEHIMFQFDNESLPFLVSSDPTRVCFCIDNIPQCENRTYIILNETRYPGETFTVSVALAAYNWGRVAGSVYTNVLGRDYKQVIGQSQNVQTVELMECTDVSYAVSSSESVVLVLTAEEENTNELDKRFVHEKVGEAYSEKCSLPANYPCVALLTTPIFISVALETCPLGFELSEANEICECDRDLKGVADVLLTCEIRNHMGYINREKTMWVGVDTSENNTDIYYWHRYCPRDYCIHNQTSVDLLSPDVQRNVLEFSVGGVKPATVYSWEGGTSASSATTVTLLY